MELGAGHRGGRDVDRQLDGVTVVKPIVVREHVVTGG